jgi:hypothetical protein
LAHSRYGLATEELAGLLIKERLTDNEDDANDTIYLVLRQLRPYFAKRDGRVDFFYESFRTAAIIRYTENHCYMRTSAGWHRSLAAYFESKPLCDRHKLAEQAWQYINGGLDEKYIMLMMNSHFLHARVQEFDIYYLINDLELYLKVRNTELYRDVILIRKMHDALRMSAFILEKDKTQLFPHLFGRLNRDEYFLNGRLSESMRQDAPIPWLLAETQDTFKYTDDNLIQSLKGYGENKIHSLLLSKDRKSIVLLSRGSKREKGEIDIRDAETGRSKKRIPCHPHEMFLTEKGDSFMVLCTDNTLSTYNMETGDMIRQVILERSIRKMGKSILSNDEKTLYIIDVSFIY